MRQFILLGLLAAAGLTIAGCGGLLLLAALVISGSSPSGGYSAGYDPEYYPAPTYTIVEPAPLGPSPADPWLSGSEFDGHLSHGTFDTSGQGNHVISVDGEVLNLP
jgi:hypothetical protein